MVKQIGYGVGNETFQVSCMVCGGPVASWHKDPPKKYKCKECRQKERESLKNKKTPLKVLQAERRMEIAVEYLESKGIIEEYSGALKVVGSRLHTSGWFQSSNEILVALELIRCGVKLRHQVKMGRWRVDFVIPDLKVVLEVDGEMYHPDSNKEKEKIRDNSILANLGPEWEVIRIKDHLIRKNLKKLLPAIESVRRSRKRVRRNFDNRLPKWYSDNQI
jgi:very-short-patch-repair endonuclease